MVPGSAVEVVLWLLWESIFFQWILEALSPWDRQRFMLLLAVPSTKPHDVFGRGRDIAEWACLCLVSLLVVDGRLVP